MKGIEPGMAFDHSTNARETRGVECISNQRTIMEPAEEKRRFDRLACRSSVEWAYFNRPEIHTGLMRDFSHYGASFECSQALVHGATVMVRLQSYLPECRSGCQESSDCPWPPSIVLGDVKWCRDLSGSGLPRFGVGVKFHLQV